MCSSLAAGNAFVPWDASNHLDSQDIVSPRDLRSTWFLIEGPAGGAAWLCPSSEVGFLEEFGEETSVYCYRKSTEVWTHGQAVLSLSFPISLRSHLSDGIANSQIP